VRRGTPQGEALLVWAIAAADTLAILVVYSLVDPSKLHAVSKGGLGGGLGRALVQLNFPSVALVAIPLMLLALDSLPRRAWLAGAPAIAMCALAAWPGVLDPNDLDAKAVNVVPALGVVVAFALTLTVAKSAGVGFAPRRRGDPARIVVAVIAALVSLPWIAAELGFHFPQGVFLTTKLYAEPHEPPTAAVHLGHHHGLDGMLLVLYALLLSRPRLGSSWLRRIYAALLALALAYGTANIVNDAWHEQLVKRGWTSWDFPSALVPSVSMIWLLVLAATGLLYVLGFAWSRQCSPER
jgi:hypothetical protein